MTTENITIKTNSEDVEAALEQFPGVLARHTKAGLTEIMTAFDRDFRKGQFGGFRGRSYASKLQVRTGALRNSMIRGKVKGQRLGSLSVETTIGGATTPYAKLQEFGGTITPGPGKKFLTIPLPSVLTVAGVLKGKFRLVNRGGSWETEEGRKTFIRQSRGGNPYIAAASGASSRIEALYILRRSVKVPPRLGFFRTFKAMNKKRFPRILQRHFQRAIDETERKT